MSRNLKGAPKRPRQLPDWLSRVAVGKKPKTGQGANHDTTISEDGAASNIGLSSGNNKSGVEDGKELSKDAHQPSSMSNASSSDKKNGSSWKLPERDIVDSDVLTVEQIIALSYSEYIFSGSLIYSHQQDDCNVICDDIMSNMNMDIDNYIGCDTEWPVTYQVGSPAKTALIQICTSPNKCYLFHVSCMAKFPVKLRELLEHPNIKKVGLNIEGDMWKLEADYDLKAKNIIQNSVVELRHLANRKLKSTENWSLEGLAKNVLKMRISKDPSVRKCDWRQYPLPEKQQYYAATDAAMSLMLYNKLVSISRQH